MPFDEARFFAECRATILKPRIEQPKVEACNAILKQFKGTGIARCAYGLATAYHETNKSIAPIPESLHYSVQALITLYAPRRISIADAEKFGRTPGRAANQVEIGNRIYGGSFGKSDLGNDQPGDGFTYRGRGMDHCTGRRNYGKSGADVGIGTQLLANPDKLLDTQLAAKVMFTGMTSGRYTGKTLSDFLPETGTGTEAQFKKARAIINGSDQHILVAGYAADFQNALKAAGW
jgi:putative chitinase